MCVRARVRICVSMCVCLSMFVLLFVCLCASVHTCTYVSNPVSTRKSILGSPGSCHSFGSLTRISFGSPKTQDSPASSQPPTPSLRGRVFWPSWHSCWACSLGGVWLAQVSLPLFFKPFLLVLIGLASSTCWGWLGVKQTAGAGAPGRDPSASPLPLLLSVLDSAERTDASPTRGGRRLATVSGSLDAAVYQEGVVTPTYTDFSVKHFDTLHFLVVLIK